MKEITITSISEEGDKAIQKHMDEFKKMSFKDRLIFKVSGYKQEVLSEKPYVLLLTLNNLHSRDPLFIELIRKEIEKAMLLNGATIDKDIKIEVRENA